MWQVRLPVLRHHGLCRYPFCAGCDDIVLTYITHFNDVTMDSIASQITSLAIVYSAVYSSADQRKHQSSASLAFVWGIHRGPVNSPHKWPVTRKMFPFDDVIMYISDIFSMPYSKTDTQIPRGLVVYQGFKHTKLTTKSCVKSGS